MSLLDIVDNGKELIGFSGVYASLDGFYQRPFGRDTYFTLLGLTYAVKDYVSSYCSEDLLVSSALSYLQYLNADGELPHEVGTKEQGFPFEIDSSGLGKLYTSIDATGLAILVLDELLTLYPKNMKLQESLDQIELMTKWVLQVIERYKGIIGYKHVLNYGSREHTWQDGAYSVLTDKGSLPSHPLYPVLEQGLYWSVLKRASRLFKVRNPPLSALADEKASQLKRNFNKYFVYKDAYGCGIARALDSRFNIIHSANIDAVLSIGFTFDNETILDEQNMRGVKEIIDRLWKELWTGWGLRTQGKDSPARCPYNYQSKSSIWPFANIMVIRTLESYAQLLQDVWWHEKALSLAKNMDSLLAYFNNPIETAQLTKEGKLDYYRELRLHDATEFISSRVQAWTVGWGYWLVCYLNAQIPLKKVEISLSKVHQKFNSS